MITIVGLGPAGPELLTPQSAAVLEGASQVVVRTRHHPAVDALDPSGKWSDCDDLYAAAGEFGAVYDGIARRVLALAAERDVVYAVPGNPLVAERSVVRLLEVAREANVGTRILPALSFFDLAVTALGIEGGTLQLCDALDLRIDAQRPALIHQVHDRDSATALKTALMEWYPADHPVTRLRALGTDTETVRELPLSTLDHEAFGYLDCIYLPPLLPLDDLRRFDGAFHVVVDRLNAAEGGCPWDLQQDHDSLRKYLLEESYELLDAIDSGDRERIAEELGDVLFQVLEHTAVAAREETFTFGDVTERLSRKLIHRHPHVFGGAEAKTAEEVEQGWEQLKQQEKQSSSVLEGVPRSLPALQGSQSIQGRARKVGFDWPGMDGPIEKLREEVIELAEAQSDADRSDEFGDVLFVVCGIAQRLGIDAEMALRGANARFRKRFELVEMYVAEGGRPMTEMAIAEIEALWQRAKRQIAAG